MLASGIVLKKLEKAREAKRRRPETTSTARARKFSVSQLLKSITIHYNTHMHTRACVLETDVRIYINTMAECRSGRKCIAAK